MSENNLVSIITPVYNAESYIEDTIKSILAQTYTDWELILVNDCSTDGSEALIKKYADDQRIKLINNDKNLKAADSRNKGIDIASGRYIAFLDADDIWKKDKLSLQVAFMKANNAAFSYTAYEFGDEKATPTGKIVKILPQMTYRKALSRTVIFTSTVMFDLELISKEMIKMPNVPSEDTATWWKVLRNGYVAFGLSEVLTIYRRPATSLSSNKKVALYRIWNLYRNMEKLSIFDSAYNFVFWAVRATLRRM